MCGFVPSNMILEDDDKFNLEILLLKGESLEKAGKWQDAVKTYTDALDYADGPLRHLTADIFNRRGACLSMLGRMGVTVDDLLGLNAMQDYGEALKATQHIISYRDSSNIGIATSLAEQAVIAFVNIAYIHRLNGEYKIALEKLGNTEIYEIFKDNKGISRGGILPKDSAVFAKVHNQKGLVYTSDMDFDKAEASFKEAFRIIDLPENAENADPRDRYMLLANLAWLYARQRKNLKIAKENYSEALELAIQERDVYWQTVCRTGLGEVARVRKNYKEAEEFYKKADSFYNWIDYKRGYAYTSFRLAQVYNAMKDYDKAMEKLHYSISAIEHENALTISDKELVNNPMLRLASELTRVAKGKMDFYTKARKALLPKIDLGDLHF